MLGNWRMVLFNLVIRDQIYRIQTQAGDLFFPP